MSALLRRRGESKLPLQIADSSSSEVTRSEGVDDLRPGDVLQSNVGVCRSIEGNESESANDNNIKNGKEENQSRQNVNPTIQADGQSMRTLAWVLAVFSVGCFALTDGDFARQTQHENIVARDQLPVVLGVLGFLWSGPLTIIAGTQKYGSYMFQFYQPLQGGFSFVIMQALGWTFYAIALGMCILIALNPNVPEGTMMGIGALGFCANALLNSSLDRFSPQRHESRIRRRINTLLGQRSFKHSFSLLLGGGTFIVLCILDASWASDSRLREDWMELALRLAVGAFGASVFVTHVLSGMADLHQEGYHFFQPFQGSMEFQVLQGIGWALFGVNVYTFVHRDAFGLITFQGAPALFGAFGFTSSTLMVNSMSHFQSTRSQTQDSVSVNREQMGSSGLLYFSWIFVLIVSLHYFLGLNLVSSGGIQLSAYIGPPLVHLGGWVKLRDAMGYRLFKPLHGNSSHILAQTFGWILYGLQVYVLLITHGRHEELYAPLCIISFMLLYASVRHYTHSSSKASSGGSDSAEQSDRSRSSSKATSSEKQAVGVSFHFTDLLAIIAAGSSFLLQVSIVDEWVWWIVHVGAGFTWFFARLFLYLLAYHGNLSKWRPFEGPDLWILCEAISWTLFIISALGSAVILGIPVAKEVHVRISITTLTTARGWITATTIGYIFSHVLIRYGALVRLDEEQKMAHGKRDDRRRRSTSMSMLLAAQPQSSGWSPWVVIVESIVQAVIFVWIDQADWSEPKSILLLQQAFIAAVSMALFGVFLTHIWVGPRTQPGYRFFQPFQGGSMFVLFQSIAWSLFSVCLVMSLIAANAGLEYVVAIRGSLSLLGAGFASSQLILVWSLRYYTKLPKFAATIDGGVGLMLSLFSVALFTLVDFAVIRFALPYSFVRPIIASAWVAACASVPLSGFVMMRSKVRKSGLYSPTLVVLGSAMWSFTILLGALLVINSVYNNQYIPKAWSATLAGLSNLASHILLALATVSTTSPREMFGSFIAIPLSTIVVYIFIRFFSYIILPSIRAFLDYPMHIYGITAKRWKGWLSPDGLQALQNIHLQRNIAYAPSRRHVLDILRPLHMDQIHTKLAKGESLAPLVYLHGGGHLAVSSELLLHSMTPFPRAGITVYSVEYPLSPDEQYPAAVFSALHALLWIQEFHCGNPECIYPCVARDPFTDRLGSHECHFSTCGFSPPVLDYSNLKPSKKDRKCRWCGGTLGTDKIQFLGDSAGGSLVAMATALLTNKELYEKTAACVSPKYEIFKQLTLEDFPKVERVGILYGLLGRQTPIRDKVEGFETSSWLWKMICHIAILLVFRLYDSGLNTPAKGASGPRSSLTDIPAEELKCYAPETMLICGESDPLLPCNLIANRFLKDLGHQCTMHVVPGTHAFHGFPVNWMRYLGVDWKTNTLPATYWLLEFFTAGRFEKEKLLAKQREQIVLPDYSPLIIFPLFLIVLPAVTLTLMLRQFWVV